MSDVFDCQQTRELTFDHRADEIGAPTLALLTAHAAGCESCEHYLENLDSLLVAAAEPGPAPTASQRSAIWDALSAEIFGRDGGSTLVAAREHKVVRPRRKQWMTLAAVAMTFGLGWWGVTLLLVDGEEPTSTTTLPLATSEAAPSEEPGLEPDGEGHQSEQAASREKPPYLAHNLEVQSREGVWAAIHPGVSVFSDETSRWTHAIVDGVLILSVDAGALLIEYLPRSDEALVVELHNRRIEIVGTIVVVDAKESGFSEVAVAAGSVRISEQNGAIFELSTGTSLNQFGVVGPVAARHRHFVQRHVDMAQHNRQVAATLPTVVLSSTDQSSRDEPVVTRDRSEPEPHHVIDDFHRRVRDAEQSGNYGEAARILETLVELSRLDPLDRGLARLELARLYTTRFHHHDRAMAHLENFLTELPDDPSAASALGELCRLANLAGRFIEGCVDSQ